ncbi:MAG: hypothetical protein ABW252_08450 [Polyangiales bacterium]
MAKTRSKPRSPTALADDPAVLATPEGARALSDALASGDAKRVALAAERIAAHVLTGHEDSLAAAYRAFAGAGATRDPGCHAKEALIIALDACEHVDAALFAEASRCVQREQAKGHARDVGARVRARGVLALARTGHVDALAIFGAALGDADATVRLSAARAVAHREQRDGAGLLLLRLGAGDGEPEVLRTCLQGLFAVAPDLAVPAAAALLEGDDARARELALSALGTAPSDQAVTLLSDQLAEVALADDRKAVIDALGLSLRPLARRVLLALLESERATDAQAALEALAIHRYDPRVVEQVRAATASVPALARLAAALF